MFEVTTKQLSRAGFGRYFVRVSMVREKALQGETCKAFFEIGRSQLRFVVSSFFHYVLGKPLPISGLLLR